MGAKNKELKPQFQFAITKYNYIWMIIDVILMITGYVLLIGGGSKDPDVFNYALFNGVRLVVSPLLIVLGLVVEVYAIMKPAKNKPAEEK